MSQGATAAVVCCECTACSNINLSEADPQSHAGEAEALMMSERNFDPVMMIKIPGWMKKTLTVDHNSQS